jgi:hypothetical protein
MEATREVIKYIIKHTWDADSDDVFEYMSLGQK